MNIMIVGASRGIGKATALEFAKSAFNNFYLTYNNSYVQIEELKKDLENKCNIVDVFQLDVRNREQIKNLVTLLDKNNARIDVLINSFGILRDKTFVKMTDDEWDEIIDTNLTGVYNVTKAFLPLLSDGGNIINIGSIIGLIGNFGQTNYAASKAGLIAFTKSLAKELAKRNIRVNMVSPSIVDTEIFKNLTDEQRKTLTERTLLKRMATPEEIAKFIVFLVKDGTYCTGGNYLIDGGFQ